MKHPIALLISLLSLVLVMIACNSDLPFNESAPVAVENPYSYVGAHHSAGLNAVRHKLATEPPPVFSESEVTEYLFARAMEYVAEVGMPESYSVDYSNVPMPDWPDPQHHLALDPFADFRDYIATLELTEDERDLLEDVAFMLDKCDTSDAAFNEMADEVVLRVLEELPEDLQAKVLSTVAVAVDSRNYWLIEEQKEAWFFTLYPLICTELGVNPDDMNPLDILEDYLECASLGEIAGADASGAIGGAVGGPPGAATGAVAASSGQITYCAVSSLVDWLIE